MVAGKTRLKLRKLRILQNLREQRKLLKFTRPSTNLGNLFKGFQTERPIQSYGNFENYNIYVNCEIFDSLATHPRSTRNIFKGLQERSVQIFENNKFV